jgi:hypothetical protein
VYQGPNRPLQAKRETGSENIRYDAITFFCVSWPNEVLATIPFAVELYRRWVVGHVNFPRAVLGLQLLSIIILMVLRTTPVRVTPNPWFWLLAFVTTYARLGFSAYAGQGVTLISPIVGNGLAVVSMIIIVYSLLSLGPSGSFRRSEGLSRKARIVL